ncbi:MAG: hypothetical protein M3Y09_15820 [Actinomycetota bacterium]|nr:hypothetical protein [Actinomycetota bacterium]
MGPPLQHTTLVAQQRAPRTFFAWAELIGTGVRLSEAAGVCLRGPDGLPGLEADSLGRGCATLRVRWDSGAKGLKTRRPPIAVSLMKAIR